MSNLNKMNKRSGVKDRILFQILEDITNMEKENCGSKFFTASEKMTNEVAKNKLMELYGLDPNMDLESEMVLINNKCSKLPVSKRTIIKFLTLVKKKGIYNESKPISVQIVNKPQMENILTTTVDSDHSIPVE